jgi:hypothetical protein
MYEKTTSNYSFSQEEMRFNRYELDQRRGTANSNFSRNGTYQEIASRRTGRDYSEKMDKLLDQITYSKEAVMQETIKKQRKLLEKTSSKKK